MPQPSQIILEPRKSPLQARSAASVDAILEATVQVLVQVGKQRLTTTKVASRAGVSVGTLYQYFPNKSALLQAALKQHLCEMRDAVELVCHEQKGGTPRKMVTALISAFLAAKMRDPKVSAALYSVSSDLDAAAIVCEMGVRLNKAIVGMLASSSEPLASDPQIMASMIQGTITGVSRRILESVSPEEQFDALREELIFAACAYIDACSMRVKAERSLLSPNPA